MVSEYGAGNYESVLKTYRIEIAASVIVGAIATILSLSREYKKIKEKIV